jgi:hypothetical protein
MSRQDRAIRGADRPATSSLAYKLQAALPFSTAEDAYLLRDRRLLDMAAARILELEAVIEELRLQLNAARNVAASYAKTKEELDNLQNQYELEIRSAKTSSS